MLFSVFVALLGTWIVCARHVTSVFTSLTSRLIAFNANWNPWKLRRRLERASSLAAMWRGEFARLRKAQRLCTHVVGCLSENEIHKHHMRMMGHDETPEISQRYIADIEAARKKDFIGGEQITRAEAMRDCATDAECEATREEFKRKPGNSPLQLVDGKIVKTWQSAMLGHPTNLQK